MIKMALIQIKMALLQKDYILVDLNTDCGNWYLPYKNETTNYEQLTGWNVDWWVNEQVCTKYPTSDLWNRWWPMWSLDFTIQVNGKLKQHRTYFEMTEDNERSQYLEIKDWHTIQEAISMLNSLWYELDVFEIQKLINQRLSSVWVTIPTQTTTPTQ